MSAYFCSSATFHLIATYAATIDATADLKTVWRQLIAENLRSLNYRYPHDQPDNVKTAAAELALMTDRPMLPLPEPGIIKSAISQYDYRACEHPQYEASPTAQLVARLLATIDAPRADHPHGWYPVEDLPQARLSDIRASIESETVSYGELAELESLADQIPPGDTLLQEWAGIPEAVATRSPDPVPPPAPPAPAPGADPMDAARAKLAALFAMPSAPDAPEPMIDAESEFEAIGSLSALPAGTLETGLSLLLTLAKVSAGHPDAARFSELAELVGASLTMEQRAWSSGKASENAAALRIVLDTVG
jgi:hypothetical protein